MISINNIKSMKTDKIIKLLKKYYLSNYEENTNFDVFVVWHCYILGYEKWLLGNTLDDMYYEVTYNKAKDEFYLDAYKKLENKCIKNN